MPVKYKFVLLLIISWVFMTMAPPLVRASTDVQVDGNKQLYQSTVNRLEFLKKNLAKLEIEIAEKKPERKKNTLHFLRRRRSH